MGYYHPDPTIDLEFVNFLDTTTKLWKSTGRGSLLIFVPEPIDEKVLVALNGSVVPNEENSPEQILDLLRTRLENRREKTIGKSR